MKFYTRLIISLAAFAGIAAGLLAITYNTTAPVIAQRAIEDEAKALENVFFLQKDDGGFTLTPEVIAEGVTALYSKDNPDEPAYFAVTGSAIGYNSGVPISLMVGFTGPADSAANLLEGYVDSNRMPQNEAGNFIVGFSVINSEETPGLGEKIKDARPPFTWLQAVTGKRPAPNPDISTDFQRQFRGREAETLVLKKNGGDLDAITASTITSNGIISALRDASGKLQETLASK